MKLKKCPKCNTDKPISEFHKNAAQHDGLQCQCKVCNWERIKCWREVNYNKYRTGKRKWEKANPNKVKCYRRKRTLASYGISVEDYEQLMRNQKHKCAICKRKVKLVVDHCHKTGKIRGLLCNTCNAGLGMLGDNKANLRRAVEYVSN